MLVHLVYLVYLVCLVDLIGNSSRRTRQTRKTGQPDRRARARCTSTGDHLVCPHILPPSSLVISQGWGLIDLPLRASNEATNAPSKLARISLQRVAWLILNCACRTSTFRSCAFHEQRGQPGYPSPPCGFLSFPPRMDDPARFPGPYSIRPCRRLPVPCDVTYHVGSCNDDGHWK